MIINNDSQDTQLYSQQELLSVQKNIFLKKTLMQSVIENSSSHIPKQSVWKIIKEHYENNK